MKRFIIALHLLFVCAFAANVSAQTWEFFPNGTYDSRITRPDDFLGYELGSRFTMHHMMVAYYTKLAAESDRVQYHTYGRTYELRPLTYLIITAPENMARLEEIRQNNLKLADPRKLTGDDEAQNIIKSNPTIAWLGYSVHGSESCSAEAAILTAYQLAAGTDPITLNILRNAVVIIDPVLNPDGRDRYAYSYNSALDKKPNPSSLAAERSGGSGGRTNHYGVDLNRDWAFLTQRETQERTQLYRRWMPQVAVDFHEMGSGSTYFFFPAASPLNANYPEQVMKWQKMYGKGNARAFDHYGWQYYTHEGFDLYYPGYGDSWPTFNGATGMTYEQGGGGSAGVILKRGEDDYLSLVDRLWGHFTTSMATIQTSMENREERLADFYEFFTSAIEEGERGDASAYLIPPPANPFTFNIMLESLMLQGIEIEKAAESFEVKDAYDYYSASVEDKEFPEGTYVLKLAQPQKRLLKVLFEQDQALPDTFFYDVSAWALPYATNIETYWTGSKITARTTPVTDQHPLKGNVINAPAKFAYLMPLKGIETTLAYYELARKDVNGGIANRPFTIEGLDYPRGTAVFHVGKNTKISNFHSLIRETADKFGVNMCGVNTGFSEKGIDLGSGRISRLVKPKVGVVGGSGAIRHMFDYRYDIDFININTNRLANLDIEEVNVVITSSNLSSALNNETAINQFKQWIRSGGVYIGWGGGTSFALSEDVKLANFEMAPRPERDEEEQKKEDEELKRLTAVERERRRRERASPGYFVKASLDTTHRLAYGMKKEIAVLKFGTTAFELPTGGGMVGIFDKNPKLSGYVYPENLERISDKGYVAYASLGRGHVILFSDNPTWREFLTGLEPLFLNAVLLMPTY